MLTILGYLDGFLLGAATTLWVGVVAALLGTGFGVILLLLRSARLKPICFVVDLYVSFARGTPLLIQIFLAYYVLPGLAGIDLRPLTAGIIALSLNSGAFVSESLRGGVVAIPRGQFEAAHMLHLPARTVICRIVAPQLLRITSPALVNEFTMLIKASALLSTITVVELTRTAELVMNETYRPVETLVLTATAYFTIIFPLSLGARKLESRLRGAS